VTDALAVQRAAAQEFLAQHQRRMAEVETRIERALAQAQALLADDGAARETAHTAVAAEAARLDELRGDLVEAEAACRHALRDVQTAGRPLTERIEKGQADLDRRAAELSRQRERDEAQRAGLMELRTAWERRLRDLESELAAVDESRQRLSEQRRRLAELWRLKRESALAEESHRGEAHQRTCEELRRERDELKQARDAAAALAESAQRQAAQALELHAQASLTETVQVHTAPGEFAPAMAQLAAQISRLEEQWAASDRRAAELHARLDEAAAKALAAPAVGPEPAANGESERLHTELEQARSELAQAQAQLAARPAEGAGAGDLQRRLEMAVEDLKAEKARTAELQAKLAQGGAAATPGGGNDWESQKRRLMAALEAESGQIEPARAAERLKIEEALRTTEDVVAEKDHEIAELKQLLEQQSSHLGSVAVGAAAVAEVLNQDEIIVQERENLQSLQSEWRDKLRQAEIDISLERAKLARERSELEERLRGIEQSTRQQDTAAKTPAEKPPRSRWLTRLGLKDQSGE
jgi:hypothetical protein